MTPSPQTPVPARSPSGLFRMATWQREVESRYERLPRWYDSTPERERRFVAWVEAEACSLAMQFGRLLHSDTPPALAAAIRTLLDALERDVVWARGMLSRRVDHAA